MVTFVLFMADTRMYHVLRCFDVAEDVGSVLSLNAKTRTIARKLKKGQMEIKELPEHGIYILKVHKESDFFIINLASPEKSFSSTSHDYRMVLEEAYGALCDTEIDMLTIASYTTPELEVLVRDFAIIARV